MNRKRLLLTLLIALIAISAIVGGTLAVFTDTEGTRMEFTAGNIEIAVSGEGWVSGDLNPGVYQDWKPGDSDTWPIVIENTGANDAWIQVWVYESTGTPSFWDAATHTITGPGAWNQWVLAHGETLTLTLTVELPQETGNEFEDAEGDLTILVLATQERNKHDAGYSCVALENKDTSTWVPIVNDSLTGVLCYKAEDGKLLVDVNAYGLSAGDYYQLDLTGGDVNNPIDGACTGQDDNFASMDSDTYIAGYWNWGTYLESSCDPGSGEGVYNYAGVYSADALQADGAGSISWGGELDLPDDVYDGVGAHVKLIANPHPGTGWTVILSEMDYLSFDLTTP